MNWQRAGLIAIISALGFASSACTDGYGYSGVGLGYGSGYYGDPYYGDPYYYGGAPYGVGLGGTFGWYDNFYYPGTGVYVYDQYRRPRRWNNAQRRYWQSRPGWNQPNRRPDWGGFNRPDRPGRPNWGAGRPGNPDAVRPGRPRPPGVAPGQRPNPWNTPGYNRPQNPGRQPGAGRPQGPRPGGFSNRGGPGRGADRPVTRPQ